LVTPLPAYRFGSLVAQLERLARPGRCAGRRRGEAFDPSDSVTRAATVGIAARVEDLEAWMC
jgi:hypothetical protein